MCNQCSIINNSPVLFKEKIEHNYILCNRKQGITTFHFKCMNLINISYIFYNESSVPTTINMKI